MAGITEQLRLDGQGAVRGLESVGLEVVLAKDRSVARPPRVVGVAGGMDLVGPLPDANRPVGFPATVIAVLREPARRLVDIVREVPRSGHEVAIDVEGGIITV